MAFTATEKLRIVAGNGTIVVGNYTNTGNSTGGDISHGLAYVYACNLQPKGTSILANQAVVNETLPNGSAVTIVTTADECGTYTIFGVGS